MPLPTSVGASALRSVVTNPAAQILVALGILVLGLLVARIAARLARFVWESRVQQEEELVDKIKKRRHTPDKIIQYLIITVTLVGALLTLNVPMLTQFENLAAVTSSVITAVLLFTLGVIVVNGVMGLLRSFITNFELRGQIETLGMSPKMLDAFLTGIKFLLYLVVIEIAIVQLGVFDPNQIINTTLTAASYGLVGLLVLLGFFGFRGLIENYAAGVYLRSAEVLEPGKRVKIDDETGEVRDIATFSTTVSTDSGYFMLAPNKELMSKEIMFKRVQAEIETLEDITDYFVSGSTAYQGPASVEMALTMFGFDVTQGDISEYTSESAETVELEEAIEDLTNGEVRAAFVEQDKITDLADECKIWFNNGALLVPYFDKSVLFPSLDEDSYVLCLGVEGDEVLVVDPSTDESGGVYYVDDVEMLQAVQAIEDNGGYLVLAPRGTTAFWRIKNDLIYSSLSLYRQLSKSLEMQLSKILRSGRVLKHIVPESVEDFTEQWREGETVTRMWTPEESGDNGNGGDGGDDGSTDNR
jgi:small-conductance mechanosensitive channel